MSENTNFPSFEELPKAFSPKAGIVTETVWDRIYNAFMALRSDVNELAQHLATVDTQVSNLGSDITKIQNRVSAMATVMEELYEEQNS